MGEQAARDQEDARIIELSIDERGVRQRDQRQDHHCIASHYSYKMKMGQITVKLDPIEYRILNFLAARPYRAFTRQRIADAVNTQQHPVRPETLDRHIARLREALGFFRDYIQTVPYIGYRFRD
jgi:DNA-binding response OmpR family regulator